MRGRKERARPPGRRGRRLEVEAIECGRADDDARGDLSTKLVARRLRIFFKFPARCRQKKDFSARKLNRREAFRNETCAP